jgi:glycosyltransferase involved in cell wall biosynthesis
VERLVFVTQLVDPDDSVLGFVIPQLRALAARFDLVVIANEVRRVPDDLDADVISLGKEHGAHRAQRGARYVAELVRVTRARRPAALFAHMCPIYLALAAPVVRTARVPSILWFVHPDDSPALRVAERLADVVLTVSAGSYPRHGAKIVPIGHAIDTDTIRPAPPSRTRGAPLHLLALGRMSPVKHYDEMVRAVAAAREQGADVTLRIVGNSPRDEEQRNRVALEQLVRTSVPGAVALEDGVERAAVPQLLASADVLVNATSAGSADKVVFEALATARPALVASPAFDELLADLELQLRYRREDERSLPDLIARMAAAPEAALARVGTELRVRVERDHSIAHWVGEVERIVAELRERRNTRTPPGRGVGALIARRPPRLGATEDPLTSPCHRPSKSGHSSATPTGA